MNLPGEKSIQAQVLVPMVVVAGTKKIQAESCHGNLKRWSKTTSRRCVSNGAKLG